LTPLEQDALAIVFKLVDGAGLARNDYDPPAKKIARSMNFARGSLDRGSVRISEASQGDARRPNGSTGHLWFSGQKMTGFPKVICGGRYKTSTKILRGAGQFSCGRPGKSDYASQSKRQATRSGRLRADRGEWRRAQRKR
jgi:hypothetical protein